MIFSGKPGTAWITGASSGIGKALSETIAAPGVTLLLSGRSRPRLQEVALTCRAAGAAVEIFPFDLENEDERKEVLTGIGDRSIDLLVNNAGMSQRATVGETLFAVDRKIMEINYFAGVQITKAVLPGMIARRSGKIIAVSSIAGLAGAPLRSAYNAAKAAQILFYSTLSNELAGSGVTAHVAIPGFVRTEVSRNALQGDGTPYNRMDSIQGSGIDPTIVAREIIRGAMRGKTRIYTGKTATVRLFLMLHRIAPALLDRILQKQR